MVDIIDILVPSRNCLKYYATLCISLHHLISNIRSNITNVLVPAEASTKMAGCKWEEKNKSCHPEKHHNYLKTCIADVISTTVFDVISTTVGSLMSSLSLQGHCQRLYWFHQEDKPSCENCHQAGATTEPEQILPTCHEIPPQIMSKDCRPSIDSKGSLHEEKGGKTPEQLVMILILQSS